MHRLVMLRLTEGWMPWPSWQCCHCSDLGVPCFASAFANPYREYNQVLLACMHCYLTGLGHCDCNIPTFPGMEYLGDGTPSLQPRGSHQAEQAHLTVAGGHGPGFVHSDDQLVDPLSTCGWETAMHYVWCLANRKLVGPILQALRVYLEHHDHLYLECQLHKLVMVAGGWPDPIRTWVEPTAGEQSICATLSVPVARDRYVDM
ncbi:uncharacterized protein UHOD_12362 [Ustilago sp. UG-2017b]|nr:uncharacterized protein UHOD_12362 [Ustilago sp. UG-2017b]